MHTKTMADVICSRRKDLGMTQKDLAEKLNVTDKAVSKWERGMACPDTAAIPKLAEILGVSLEELMTAKPEALAGHKGYLGDLILKAVPLAMGIAVAVTALLGEVNTTHGLAMLGIGMACLAIRQLRNS